MREFLPRHAIAMAVPKPENKAENQSLTVADSISFAGNRHSQILFVREGGVQTDSGPAQTLFTKMLQAMSLSLESVLICSLAPTISTGELRAELAVLKLKTIIALGEFSAQKLLDQTIGLTELRNSPQSLGAVTVIPTFAPSTLLENPELKKQAWADLQKALV